MKISEIKNLLWEYYMNPLRNNASAEISSKNHITFSDTYCKLTNSFQRETNNTKIQNVFLTLLHLANEKNLTIKNEDNDLKIEIS